METSNHVPENTKITAVDSYFHRSGNRFASSFEALRETHAELAVSARELDWGPGDRGPFGPEVKRLEPEAQQLLASAIEDALSSGDTSTSVPSFLNTLLDKVSDTDWGPRLVYRFYYKITRPKREPIFHGAMLTSIVSAFEAHLAQVIKGYYRAAPGALKKIPKDEQKEFSLSDLQALNSIDDAVDLAIENRVNKIMFGSLEDWRRFFDSRLKIKFDQLSSDWTAVREVFERRHCIVHNQGLASRRYIENNEEAELNDSLQPDSEYVRDAADRLELLGILIHLETWKKFCSDHNLLVDGLEETAFEALKAERWVFSRHLYRKILELSPSGIDTFMAKVNIFICEKRINGLEKISPSIQEWNVSGLEDLFVFAKYCLLEDLDQAFPMLPDLIERRKINGESLASWPLLEPLRADDRIRDYADIMRNHLHENGTENRHEETVSD